MPASVLAYFQLGQFLMLVMVFSWFYSTFIFLSICTMIGPNNDFGQLSFTRLLMKCGLCLCQVKPKDIEEPVETNELGIVKPEDSVIPAQMNVPEIREPEKPTETNELDIVKLEKPAETNEPDIVKPETPADINEPHIAIKLSQDSEKPSELNDLGIVNEAAVIENEITTKM